MRCLFLLLYMALAACGGGGSTTPAAPVAAFYGDSITSGTHSSDPAAWVPAQWSPSPVQHIAALANVAALDYSYNGASSADAHIAADASTLVVIRFGVADQVRGMDAQSFGVNITRLVGEARALGKAVLLTGLPHAATVDTQPIDAVMRERAQALGVPFVDVRELPFAPGDLADPLHPAESYSRRIGAAIAAQIR
jgi:hypothetical protein